MTNQTILLLVLAFAATWALQMWLGGRQARRFMRSVRQVRVQGRTAIGVAGRRSRGKAYVALAADAADRVVGARLLTGRTVFASPRDLPELVGHELADLLDPGTSPLADGAVADATADAARHLLGEQDPADDAPGADEAPVSDAPRPTPTHLPGA